jgi:SAM-dependent methyltransferase
MINQTTSCCRVCGSSEALEWLYPREMMFGMREKFAYFRCSTCGCLQLNEVPVNLDKFYPNDYYSYQTLQDVPASWTTKLKRRWAYPAMTRHKLGWGSVPGRLLCHFKKGPSFPHWLRLLARPVSLDGAILDVGCGSGATLLGLFNCGFTNLRGIDPFISKSITYTGGVRVDKGQLQDVQDKFNLITFNHVFEHLDDPLATLQQTRRLLSENGQILIRIPLSDSQAARQYRENWVQLDAPRHIMLHTRKSMDLIARKSGLKIDRVTYDSTDFQFWGSEQYLLDISLMDPRSHLNGLKNSVFKSEKIKLFTEQSERLNEEHEGDQAAFVLVTDIKPSV